MTRRRERMLLSWTFALSFLVLLAAPACSESNEADPYANDEVSGAGDGIDAAGGEDSGGTVQPPLGEPEWRVLDIGQGDVRWNGIHGVIRDGGGYRLGMVGAAGTYAQYDSDADEWDFRNLGQAEDLHAVWLEGDEDIVVAGDGGVIRRWDTALGEEGDWRVADSIVGIEESLLDIWGDKDSQWLCGDKGVVARYDSSGDRWDVKLYPNNPTTEGRKLEAVWGTGPDDVFFVGNRIIAHWDGTGVFDTTTVDYHLHGVWGTRDGRFYAAGDNGVIMVLDRPAGSTEWIETTPYPGRPYQDIWGLDPEHIYAVAFNTGLIQGEASTDTWEIVFVEERPGLPPEDRIPQNIQVAGIWGTSADSLFLVGRGGELVRRGRFAIED